MQCIAIVAKRFIVSKALSERYVYTSDHDTLCIVLTTTIKPCNLSNIAILAILIFRVHLYSLQLFNLRLNYIQERAGHDGPLHLRRPYTEKNS